MKSTNRSQRKQPLPIFRNPAYRRAIQQIEEALVLAGKRHSSLSDEEKINRVRLALFGADPVQILDSDNLTQTGTIQSSPA